MSRLPYNQLEIFLAIAQQGSIRGAARALSISAPSVSQALRQLEVRLGVPLFIRSTRQIRLTDAGESLKERAEPAFLELSDVLNEVGAQGTRPSGRTRITMPRFVFQLYFRSRYAEFCRTYPEIELEVSVDDRAVDVIAQGFDLGIRIGDRIAPGMVARRLSDPMTESLFASPDYVAQHGTPNDLDELGNHRLIQYRFMASNLYAPLMLLQEGESVRVDPLLSMVVNDTDLMMDAALNGLGIGRAVTPMVRPFFDQGELVPVLSRHWYQYPGLYLYFPQGAQKARRVRALIDYLCERPL